MFEARFHFVSSAAQGDQFSVVGFDASEGLSQLFRYELEIKVSRSASVDPDEVMDSPARFVVELEGQEFPVHGVLSTLDEIKTVQGYVHYRAILVPRLWWLAQYKTNEIYTFERRIDKIIQSVLENAGLTADTDFDLANLTTGNLIERDFRCQFGESDFDFLSRLMEHEGIFYYFDHSDGCDKIVFHNGTGFLKIQQPELIFDTSTQTRQLHDSIDAWTCRRQRLPAHVSVRDFNPDQPSLDISDTVSIDPMGRGTEYQYGDNIRNESEATTLSEIRAEERLCHKTRYYGESSVPRLRPGFTFNLDMHPNEAYNGVEYLVLEVNHSGAHLDIAMSGARAHDPREQQLPQYRNSFVALAAGVQFRPPRVTPKPRFYGTMSGFIYAEVGHNQAEIDEFGRYRVHLPFDRADGSKNSSDPNRKASAWIRRATDYVGENKGSYFPLTGGTEVLLSFINGDPDQPVIVGALPNASEPSLMTSDNQFESVTQTGSGNRIRMGDIPGEDRIVMESPASASWVRIGTPNDPLTDLDGDGMTEMDIDEAGATDGSGGLRFYSKGSIWSEAVMGKYGEYIGGAPKHANIDAADVDYSANTSASSMLGYFNTAGSYKPRGLKARFGGKGEDLDVALQKAEIKVSSLDTFNTQEGNIYDFGGYWNYNLGNSFAEEHINQSPLLNETNEYHWPNSDPTTSTSYPDVASSMAKGAGDAAAITGAIAFAMGVYTGAAVGVAATCSSVSGAGAFGMWLAGNGVVIGAASYIGALSQSGSNFQGNVGDVFGAPGTGTIKTWAERVGSSFKRVNADTGKPGVDSNGYPDIEQHTDPASKTGPMHSDTTWVNKKFGDDYSYTRGNEIDIRVGCTEQHQRGNSYEFLYGGIHEEMKFNGDGRLVAWEQGGQGVKQEANWHQATGLLLDYTFKKDSWFTYEANLVTVPTLKISTSMSTLRGEIDLSAGAFKMGVTAAAGIEMDVNLCAGIFIKMEAKRGGEVEWNEVTGWSSFKSFGLAAQKKAAIEAELQTMLLNASTANIDSKKLDLQDGALELDGKKLKVGGAGFTFQ